jgi:S1-C subfamily serine protease
MVQPSRSAALAAGLVAALGALAWCSLARPSGAAGVDKRVLEAEVERVAVVAKVKPAVVAIFAQGGQGGGSGVLITKDGYALTNFHVVEGSGPVMQCGLPDGVLYDAVLVGLDRVGDVALIKLIPPKAGQEFPCAVLGDSDTVKAGDWSLALGNPFLLATDFQPTVTYGLVSGVHRYQYPAGTLLEYTDCIQVDTSINPGNSGGPLFNTKGELIGINGRGSFEKRGRVNSGVGYAISINQIKNFLGHLRGGLDSDHATLGASVRSESEEDGNSGMIIDAIIEDSDPQRRGLDVDDELVSFAGRPMRSVNQFKNVLGLFPKGWRVPMVYRRKNQKHEILVRLMQLQHTQNPEEVNRPRPRPGPPRPQPPPRPSPASKFYEPKPGFANYYFNKLERDRLLAAFRKHGDFSGLLGDWVISSQVQGKDKLNMTLAIREEVEDKYAQGRPLAHEGTYHLKPESLPPLPDADTQADQTPLRQAVIKAAGLLRKHARSFPQEFWAEDTPDALKQRVLEVQKDVATIQVSLQDALDELAKVGAERSKEMATIWKANYDFTRARLTAFVAYLYEYNFLLGQLRKDALPPRDPKLHRGWRMEPQEALQSGPEAKKLVAEAAKSWDQMAKDYRGSAWETRARAGRQLLCGVKWVATGGTKTVVRLNLGAVKFKLDPLQADQTIDNLMQPTGSGGMMEALYQYRRLLTLGPEGFEGQCTYGGYEPLYPPPKDGKVPESVNDLRVDCEVLVTEHAAVTTKWYFAREDQTLLGFEATLDKDHDPCEVYLADYRPVDGRSVPHRIEVRYKDASFGVFQVESFQVARSK